MFHDPGLGDIYKHWHEVTGGQYSVVQFIHDHYTLNPINYQIFRNFLFEA